MKCFLLQWKLSLTTSPKYRYIVELGYIGSLRTAKFIRYIGNAICARELLFCTMGSENYIRYIRLSESDTSEFYCRQNQWNAGITVTVINHSKWQQNDHVSHMLSTVTWLIHKRITWSKSIFITMWFASTFVITWLTFVQRDHVIHSHPHHITWSISAHVITWYSEAENQLFFSPGKIYCWNVYCTVSSPHLKWMQGIFYFMILRRFSVRSF